MGAGLNLNMGVVRGNGVEHTGTSSSGFGEFVESIGGESRGDEFGKSRDGEFGKSRGGEFGERVDGDIIFVSGDAVSSFTLLPVWVCNKAP